jgi:hypothetical protein
MLAVALGKLYLVTYPSTAPLIFGTTVASISIKVKTMARKMEASKIPRRGLRLMRPRTEAP